MKSVAFKKIDNLLTVAASSFSIDFIREDKPISGGYLRANSILDNGASTRSTRFDLTWYKFENQR
jgi:hypothetical protein